MIGSQRNTQSNLLSQKAMVQVLLRVLVLAFCPPLAKEHAHAINFPSAENL
jgi:hypothetical protein